MINIHNHDSRPMTHDSPFSIHEGAIFIADSHYNKERNELVTILEKIKSGDIQTTQLFLMGDIFDFLCEESTYFKSINKTPINLINDLSKTIEIFYFEGNHDYNLYSIFPNITIFPRESQPVAFTMNSKIGYLSHGDIYTDKSYNIYCKIIRNHLLLKFINFIDIKHIITKTIEKKLLSKQICKKINNFEYIVQKRIQAYPNCDYIIEGHFHQNYNLDYKKIKYFNLPSAFCSKSYVKMSLNCNFLEEINI